MSKEDSEPDFDTLYVGNPDLSSDQMLGLYTDAWRDVSTGKGRGSVAVLGRLFVELYPRIESTLASTFGKFALDNENKIREPV
jgi:hypothetical protein